MQWIVIPIYLWILSFAFGAYQGPGTPPASKTSESPDVSLPHIAGSVSMHPAFDRYTVEDGLCSNTILKLFQDSRGFLWMGTDGGLNRYDGYAFQAFIHKEGVEASLPSNEIFDIKEDHQGNIWVLTPKGVAQMQPDGNFINISDTLISTAKWMVIDKRNRIWFRCNKGLARFDIPTRTFAKITNFFAAPFLREDGELFALGGTLESPGYHNQVLKWVEASARFDVLHDTISLAKLHEDLSFNAGAFDKKGNLWLCRQDGWLLQYNFETNHYTYIPDPPNAAASFNFGGSMYDICYSDRNNVLWTGGLGGLMRYDLNLNAAIPVIRFMHNDLIANSLPVRVARSVLEDNAGNIWVGTVGGGLCCYAPGRNKFQVFQKHICDPAPLAGNKVEALSFDAGGRLWAGTDKGLSLLENRNDGIFRSFYHTPTPGKSANYDWIYDMVADSASGDLYLAYWGNLPDRFNTQTMQFEPLRISNLSSADLDRWGTPYMFSVAGDHRGNLFFSTWSGGGIAQKYNLTSGEMNLFDWDTDEYARQSGLLSFESTKAYPTRDGKLWLGNSEGKGLIQVDFSKLTVHHQVIGRLQLSYQPLSGGITNFLPNAADSTALQDGSVGDMLEDRKGRLWIGTDAGLHWMANREKGVFRHFGKAQGLPDTKINAIVEDDRGYLWLGTQNGLCCFDPDAARVIAVYGTEDGLPDKVFMAQAGAKSPTGELAFGTAKGFCLFHPDSLFQNTQAPGIQLCNLEVNGAKRPIMPDGIELGYNEKNLVFDFAAMDFSNPRKNQYQYYLEGFDDKWSAPTPIHHVVYNNLSSGNYVLHIRGSNNDGFWSKSSLRFPVTIYTPWWNAWWFRTILLLMFLGFVWAFVWIRETRMRKKQEDNEKEIKYQQAQTLQAQINHHFIFNVLGAIQNQILNNDKKEANRQLVNLSKLIRRFLDSSSQSDNPLDQEIELLDMYIQFEQSQRPGKFTYKIEVDESINPQNTTIPPLMIQPYVENAIKHGLLYKEDSGHLEIRFFKQGEALVCTVDDDGVGRKKAGEIQQKSHKIYKSHGTRLVQERIARLNGLGYHIEIQTQDQPDGGTLVTIKFSE